MKQNDSDVLKASGINSKGYGMFPKLVAKDRRLTIEAKSIYAYICSYAGSGNTAFPKVATIVYDLNIGEDRYRNHSKLLVKYGYISVEQIRSEKGKFDHNVYTLNTEILDTDSPYPQNKGTVKNDYHPHPHDKGTDDARTDDGGINTNSSKINNLEEEEEEEDQTEKFPKKYIEMALKVGATKLDLAAALKKMDQEADIKSSIAWLQTALENEVMNRELESRPKTKKDPKPSTKPHAVKRPKTDSNKYDNFYL